MIHYMYSQIPITQRAILGACVGDAAGATLEFIRKPITEQTARTAMTMPGGGMMGVGPGQITDDGELTLALWSSIRNRDSYHGIPRTNMMRAYANWIRSEPFDCGHTCGYAFATLASIVPHDQPDQPTQPLDTDKLLEWESKVHIENAASQANGALMRSTAIACWIAGHPQTPITHVLGLSAVDAELSHPNPICVQVNQIYTLACCLLMRGATPQETLRLVSDYVIEEVQSETVKQWFLYDSHELPQTCTREIGHVRWAFTLAIYFLRNPSVSYEDAICQTLQKGGDTDTNACIVGGLVACYQPIPDAMLRPVLEFDCTTYEYVPRPKEYSVREYFPLI